MPNTQKNPLRLRWLSDAEASAPKPRKPARKPKAAKPVMAWACVRPEDGAINPYLIYPVKSQAKSGWRGRVARVRIVEVRR